MTTQLQYPSSTSSPSSNSSSSAASRPRNPYPDDSSTEDEEEVIFDLDETAMAQLPVHLQRTMREIQRERVRRFSQGPESVCMSMSMGPRSAQSHDTYADRWVRNVMARMSTDRGARDKPDTDVNPFERLLEPVGPETAAAAAAYMSGDEHGTLASSGRYYGRTMSGRSVFLGCVGSFERNALVRCRSGRHNGGAEEKFAANHVSEVHVLAREGEETQHREGKRGQFRKTIISTIRVRVKRSFQKMGMLLRK